MKKYLLVASSLSIALSACMPAFLKQPVNPVPTKNAQATAAVLHLTSVAEATNALPTSTQSPTSTFPPTGTSTTTPIPATQTFTETATLFSTEITGTAYTPTNVTGTPGMIIATITPGGPTETPHALYYGTQPPAVPFGKLLMMNKSHVDAYISLQCMTKDKALSIEEYPVGKWMLVRIASGKCNYVAWVGGRQFTGSFTLPTSNQRTITIYKNWIKIK